MGSAGPVARRRGYTACVSQQTADALRATPLFSRLDESQLAALAAIAKAVALPAQSSLFVQGERATGFYLLAEGRLKIYKLLPDGRTATIRHVGAGETFGEAALFHESYVSSTETMTACRLFRFETQEFLDLLTAQPQLAINLLAAMAELLALLNRRVEELLLPVPARLARYLLNLADEQLAGCCDEGVPPAPRVVRLPTSKRELAARLGTVPETLSRTFDRFKRAEVIRMSSGHELIEILSFEKLQRLGQE